MRKITKNSGREIIRYKKGQRIVSLGDSVNFIASVKSGEVKLYKPFEGRDICIPNMRMFKEWSQMMVLTGEKSDYMVEAMGIVELEKTPKDKFLKEIKANSRKQMETLTEFSKLFLKQTRRYVNITGASAIGKVATVILDMSGEGYPLTHKLVASLTGLTRETVTLQMLKMEKMKLIDNANRKIKILNRKGLEKFLV
ncbi:Crp/Fnr family transcriptional regulator [Candidatus Shapirobacteria bacterium]|nr:Crp/Fnr family transcriptional regulator [Candidatus Shapirobacteria bacterium]